MGVEQTFWERLVANIVARGIYFVGTLVLLPVLTALGVAACIGRSYQTEGIIFQQTLLSAFPTSAFWMLVIAASIVAAWLGPARFAQENKPGRGEMEEIREESEMGEFRDSE